MNYLFYLTLFATLLQEAWLMNPGLRTTISKKGLEYIVEVATPLLEAELAKIKIPDQDGDFSIKVGKVRWKATSIDLNNIQIPKAAITTSSAELSVSAGGIKIAGGANWHYKTKKVMMTRISDSGKMTLSITNTNLSVTVKIGRNSKGYPALSGSDCKFNIGHVGVHFSGGASWLYNLFDSKIAGAIKGALNDQVCKLAIDAIKNQANKALETLPLRVNIDETALIDYSFVKDPVFNNQYMETDRKGEFMSRTNPQEVTFSPAALPAIGNTADKMLYIWLTSYTINTAGVVYQKAGILQSQITPDEPKNLPIKLNTASYKTILPTLYTKYPNMNMTLLLRVTQPPVFTVDPHGANATLNVDVDVCVIDSSQNNAVTPVFNLSIILYTDVTIGIKEEGIVPIVIGKTNFLGAKSSSKFSSIGDIKTELIQIGVNLLCKEFVIKLLNKYAAVGIEIPLVKGVRIVSPQIILGKDFIRIDTDIDYKPSAGKQQQQQQQQE